MIKLENGKCSVIIERLQAKMTFLDHFLPAAHPWPDHHLHLKTFDEVFQDHTWEMVSPSLRLTSALHQCFLLLLSAYWITISYLSWQMHNHKYNLLDFETVSHGLFISFFVSRQDFSTCVLLKDPSSASVQANKYIFPSSFRLYFSAKKAQIETAAWFITF